MAYLIPTSPPELSCSFDILLGPVFLDLFIYLFTGGVCMCVLVCTGRPEDTFVETVVSVYLSIG